MHSDRANPWADGASSAAISPSDDVRVVAALEEYLHLLRGGARPGRADFLAHHQSIADVLADRLDGLEFVENAAGILAATGSIGGAIDDSLTSVRLGEYRIIREVGRGGMGVVYEAEQLPLGRRVALKVLPSTASLDPRQRQRFQVEAQAAALLHHEHIVPVFGIGCDQGVHYYAMQFIEGRSLTDLIRSLRPEPQRDGQVEPPTSACTPTLQLGTYHSSVAESAGSSLNNRQHCQMAAQLGLQTARALEHAHEIGVIHRDIKPSNLLIDARDHLWVADFGLARLPQEEHDLTRTGDLLGTLRYMSPEQLSGERGVVDGRTDIYALGVTLYELLTLRPAFDALDRNQLLRRIIEEEPTRPRRFNPSIPRDLETIILKAMESEPSARYASARALADDLQRFLENQPIQARRSSCVDRAVKWSRRHRPVVVASTTALLVTLATSTAVLWEAKRRTDASLVADRAARHKEHAALHFSLGMLDQITRPLLVDAGSDASRGGEAKRVVPLAIACYDRISNLFSDDDRMQEMVAMAFRQAGHSRMCLGNPRGRRDYREAIRIYENLAVRDPGLLWYRAGLIETLHEYAGLLETPADAVEADVSLRRALNVAEALFGNKEADRHCFSMRLVGPFNRLAWELARRRAPARDGDAALAIRLARKAVDWEPEQYAYWNTLGVAYYRVGDWSDAAAALRKSMELGNGGNAFDWFFLAAITHQQGDADQARLLYDRAVSWVQQNPVPDKVQAAELRGIRAEAAQVLGLLTAPEERGNGATDTLLPTANTRRALAEK